MNSSKINPYLNGIITIVLVPTLHEELEEIFHKKVKSINPKKILYLTESFSGSSNSIESPDFSILSSVIELLLVSSDPVCKISSVCHFTLDVCERLSYKEYLEILINSILTDLTKYCRNCIGSEYLDQWFAIRTLIRRNVIETEIRNVIIELCEKYIEDFEVYFPGSLSEIIQNLYRIINEGLCNQRETVIEFINSLNQFREPYFIKAIENYISGNPEKTLIIIQLGPAHIENIKKLLEGKGYRVLECFRINSRDNLDKCLNYIRDLSIERDPEFDVIYEIPEVKKIEERDPEFDLIYE